MEIRERLVREVEQGKGKKEKHRNRAQAHKKDGNGTGRKSERRGKTSWAKDEELRREIKKKNGGKVPDGARESREGVAHKNVAKTCL